MAYTALEKMREENRKRFGKDLGPQVEILTAKLENDAGSLGAAALVI